MEEVWTGVSRISNYWDRDLNWKIMHNGFFLHHLRMACVLCVGKWDGREQVLYTFSFARKVWEGIERLLKEKIDSFEKAVLHQNWAKLSMKRSRVLVRTKVIVFKEVLKRTFGHAGKDPDILLNEIAEAIGL